MPRTRVAVLYGGPSNEREVSLRSGRFALGAMDRNRYEPIAVEIGADGRFEIGGERLAPEAAVPRLAADAAVIFPSLHGAFGEDGQLQRLLEAAGARFVGSGSAACALAMNKVAAAAALARSGIDVPRGVAVAPEDPAPDLRYPIVVKPVDEGSSLGVTQLETPGEYARRRGEIFGGRQRMLAQEFAVGRELTCAVLERGGEPFALPPSEIVLASGQAFDYDAKYTPGACREETPANLPEETLAAVRSLAERAHRALGCRSVSRTDIILSPDGALWALEVNAIPGMTPTSFLPQQAAAAGISPAELVALLIESSGR